MDPASGQLQEEFSLLGISISKSQQERLGSYLKELQHWNRTVNLTSLQDAGLVRRLIVEPIWIGRQLQVSGSLADIGSGNGSPGIPLYIGCELRSLHLIEARIRRAAFLRHVAMQLGNGEILVYRSRVETFESFPRVDWVTLQALGLTRDLVGTLHRLFGPTTRVVWITANSTAPVEDASRICVPGSETEAWVFKLDQF